MHPIYKFLYANFSVTDAITIKISENDLKQTNSDIAHLESSRTRFVLKLLSIVDNVYIQMTRRVSGEV